MLHDNKQLQHLSAADNRQPEDMNSQAVALSAVEPVAGDTAVTDRV